MQQETKKSIFKDRKRTNILKSAEQKLILYLVKRVPLSFTPNILTFIGSLGSLAVLIGFLLAKNIYINYLLICILGLLINWFGDSLDGRIAYYRGIPRKWFGFSLDIIMDWLSTIMISLGYFYYAPEEFKVFGFIFLALYGWAMIISQLRYKITDKYIIDSGAVGPTEIRVIIALILVFEIIFPSFIQYAVIVISLILTIINIKDTRQLLKYGDERDLLEKKQ